MINHVGVTVTIFSNEAISTGFESFHPARMAFSVWHLNVHIGPCSHQSLDPSMEISHLDPNIMLVKQW